MRLEINDLSVTTSLDLNFDTKRTSSFYLPLQIDAERSNLAANLSLRESEISELTLQSRTATACSVLPLALLVFAIIVAYLPSLSSIFGTAEKI